MKLAIRVVGYVLLLGGFIAVYSIETINANDSRRVVAVQKSKLSFSESFTRDEVWVEMDELNRALADAHKSTFPYAFAMLAGAIMLVWCRGKKGDV